MKKSHIASSIISVVLLGIFIIMSGCEEEDNNPKVPALTTSTVSDITQTTATCGGNITNDGGAAVTARGVCWSNGQTPTVSDSKTMDGNGTGSFTSNLTGLTANTLYYVRAYAINSAGMAYGNEINFTTTDIGIVPIVTTDSITNITETSAIGGGNVTSQGSSMVTARGICWSTLQNPTISDNYTTDGGGTGTFTSNITGLDSNTPYYVRAYATNNAGTAYGNQQSFTSTWSCGDPITINHVAGNVAPVTKTTTYGTATNIPGETSKCWITSNLGSDHQATIVDDATEASAGWYWQFNRMQGYKHDGTTLTPAWTITSIYEISDWIATNDPCTLELGSGWRLPTSTEWTNVDASGYWTDWNGPWNSNLKMHLAGLLMSNDGLLDDRASVGYYWSSSNIDDHYGRHLIFAGGGCEMINGWKVFGLSLRCLRDL